MPIDRLAYAALIYVGENEAKARAGAEKLLWYITANKVPPHFANPPGYVPVEMNIRLARGAHNVVSAHGTKQATVDGAIEAGTMFAGTPDQVFQQFKKHWDYVGGYGHLLIMGQAGFLEHDDTIHGIRMFARRSIRDSRSSIRTPWFRGRRRNSIRWRTDETPPTTIPRAVFALMPSHNTRETIPGPSATRRRARPRASPA